MVEDNPSDDELTKHAFRKAHIANEPVVAGDGQISGLEVLERVRADARTRRMPPS